MVPTIAWRGEAVVMVDQRRLPNRTVFLRLETPHQVIRAIRSLVIRGAPAIGIAAAMGLALGAKRIRARTRAAWERKFESICQATAAARPTAVNLTWAVNRIRSLVAAHPAASAEELASLIRRESELMLEEDVAVNRALGRVGAEFVPEGARILTHCNAGALATGGFGTALGVVRAAVEAGKRVEVIADETRPFLQGARLTAYELQQDGIPVKVITDNMAGALMRRGLVDLVIVGADRIAMNGDVANKIGTYSVAVLARTHQIPFYVAAPCSTIDPDCPSGDLIPIEERDPREVTHFQGRRVAPEGVGVFNPAFDVTPAEYLSAIFTERGAVKAPYHQGLARIFDNFK